MQGRFWEIGWDLYLGLGGVVHPPYTCTPKVVVKKKECKLMNNLNNFNGMIIRGMIGREEIKKEESPVIQLTYNHHDWKS